MNKVVGVLMVVGAVGIGVFRVARSYDRTVTNQAMNQDAYEFQQPKLDPNYQPQSQVGKDLKPFLVRIQKLGEDFEKLIDNSLIEDQLTWAVMTDPAKRQKLKAGINTQQKGTIEHSRKLKDCRQEMLDMLSKHRGQAVTIDTIKSDDATETRLLRLRVEVLTACMNLVKHVENSKLVREDGQMVFANQAGMDKFHALNQKMIGSAKALAEKYAELEQPEG